jgi:3-phenylpropionate/trans-cinnamate dioxygenase beta subunit
MTSKAPTANTIAALGQALFREAASLDDGRYEDWLEMLCDDIVYTAPIQQDLAARQASPSPGLALSFFQETKGTLQLRVAKIRTGLAQTESPPSRVVRVISNVLVEPEGPAGEHAVRSAFVVYRQHRQRDVEVLAGHRSDQWRRSAGGWRLARRDVRFAANVLPVKSLPLFY